jgi:hypothetical protein
VNPCLLCKKQHFSVLIVMILSIVGHLDGCIISLEPVLRRVISSLIS